MRQSPAGVSEKSYLPFRRAKFFSPCGRTGGVRGANTLIRRHHCQGDALRFAPRALSPASDQIHPFDPGEFEDLLQHLAVRVRSPNPQEKVGGDFLFFQVLA